MNVIPARTRLLPLLLLTLTVCLLPACGVYRINIQQGNFLEEETIDQIEVGMTRSQVRFLLGTPLVEDVFHEDRWDYVYYLKLGKTGEKVQRHFIVFFEDDAVSEVRRVVDDS